MGSHILFETGIRRLGSRENGFFYRYPGTGETVLGERVLSRIDNLKVPPAWEKARIARASYISPRVIDHYLEGSVVAYHAQHLDEVIAAEQGDLTDGEQALLELLNKELRRDLRKAA